MAALTACGGGSASGSAGASVSNGVYEPISICAPSRSVKDLIDVVHKYYPEIVFNVDAYSGPNGTIYMQDQLEADCQADVYSITYTARRLRHDPDGRADAGDGRSGSHPCHPQRQKPAGQDDPHPCHETANAFTEDMEKSKEAGMDEHLSEPVDIAVLERAVRKYLVTPPKKK